MIKFTIPLNPVTKKNHGVIAYAGKRCPVCKKGAFPKLLPSKQYREYEKTCKKYMPKIKPISEPVNVKATYYMRTRHKVDLVNLHEALHDILVKYGVLEDDNSKIIVSTDGSRVEYDKENPRTEVEIKEAKNV